MNWALQAKNHPNMPALSDADISTHERFMRRALYWAKKAFDISEVPIGCVIVHDGKIIAHGYNLRQSKQDVTLHAELCAIRSACRKLGSWRLENCDIYVTLEPCSMCAGAIIQARMRHLYFGAFDPKAGAVISKDCLLERGHNHRVGHTSGVLEAPCSKILNDFFQMLRTHKKSRPESTK